MAFMRGCDDIEVIRVGLALPVRRQRGTGHRGGAVLVPAAPHAEIDTNAPSARCAAAHCGVLAAAPGRVVGLPCSPHVPSVALPVAVSLEPLLAHLRPDRRPFLLDARRAAADLARPHLTLASRQCSLREHTNPRSTRSPLVHTMRRFARHYACHRERVFYPQGLRDRIQRTLCKTA